jgi:hypothetical protein
MMNELVNRVTEKTGLSPDQAKAAVETVLGLLKERLPAPLANGLESLVGSGESGEAGSGEGLVNNASGMIGSLFRKDS